MRILFRIVWKVQLFTAWFIMFLVIREPFSAFRPHMKSAKKMSFRVVIQSNQVPYEGQAIITNSPNAWGSDNGKVGCVALGAVKLNEENGYLAAFDRNFFRKPLGKNL